MLRQPNRRRGERGQAIVMVTLALIAMFGIMGLAVDVGWSFFVRKQAQGAADSAALAAVQAAFDAGAVCTKSACTTPVPCPGAPSNLAHGCQYAKANGFETAGNQTVTLEADIGSSRQPPTVPYIDAQYWATARVQQKIPQLFSGVLGNPTATSGARATAAILRATFNGALILLNRQRDCLAWAGPNSVACGVNLWASGNSYLKARGGIMMASTRHGDDLGISKDGAQYAGFLNGGAKVDSDVTMIRGAGTPNVTQTDPNWTQPWQNGFPDSDFFKDPMRNLNGQPPPSPATGNNVPVTDCTITGGADFAHRLQLNPGKYYSVAGTGGCQDGDPIKITGYVEFLAGSAGFGDYTFFGGLKTVTSTNITFNPGRYTLAGVKASNNAAGTLFDASSGQVTLTDQTPLVTQGGKLTSQPNTDAGELFIFTDPTYPNLDTSGVPSTVLQNLTFGSSGFQTGNNNNVTINLHGLNKDGQHFPSDLLNYFEPNATDVFQPVLMWQDQRNSVTRYYSGTNKVMACITGDSTSGCVNTLANPDSPMLSIAASATIHLYGVIYQPRGAWTSLSGGDSYSGPLRLITGAIRLNGGADLDLSSLSTPMIIMMVALIE